MLMIRIDASGSHLHNGLIAAVGVIVVRNRSRIVFAALLAAAATFHPAQGDDRQSPKERIFDPVWQPPTETASTLEKTTFDLHSKANDDGANDEKARSQSVALNKRLAEIKLDDISDLYTRVTCANGICEAAVVTPPKEMSDDESAKYYSSIINEFNKIDGNISDVYIIANRDTQIYGMGVVGYFRY